MYLLNVPNDVCSVAVCDVNKASIIKAKDRAMASYPKAKVKAKTERIKLIMQT